MADYEFPSGLVDAQRAFQAADAKVVEIHARMPSPTVIAAGQAAIPDELRLAHEEARAERGRALDVLYGHSWWLEVPREEQHAARTALRQAALG